MRPMFRSSQQRPQRHVTDANTWQRPTPPPRRKWPLVGLLVVASAIMVAVLISPLSRFATTVRDRFDSASASTKAAQVKQLTDSVQSIIAANPQLSIGVSVTNLGSGTQTTIGQTTPFEGASTTKLITAAAFLHSVENGRDSLSEMLGDYPANYQLQQMVNQSDNDSWALIDAKLGDAQLQAYAQGIGVTSYNVANNNLTASDMADFLRRLDEGQLLNRSDTALLLSLMQQTNNDGMIPRAVPAGATFYHKYGDLNGELHDVGLISQGNHKFALVIYTNGADGSDYSARVAVIQAITRAVCAQEL